MNALITGATITTVALVIFFFMLRKILNLKGELHDERAIGRDYQRANEELARELVHARRAPATESDGQRVLDKIVPRTSL